MRIQWNYVFLESVLRSARYLPQLCFVFLSKTLFVLCGRILHHIAIPLFFDRQPPRQTWRSLLCNPFRPPRTWIAWRAPSWTSTQESSWATPTDLACVTGAKNSVLPLSITSHICFYHFDWAIFESEDEERGMRNGERAVFKSRNL